MHFVLFSRCSVQMFWSKAKRLTFKSKYLKKLLGYNGRRLKRIAKVSKTAIKHVGSISEEFEVGHDEEFFSITGSEEVIATGLTMMEQAIPDEASTIFSDEFIIHCNGNVPEEDTCEPYENLQCPANYVKEFLN